MTRITWPSGRKFAFSIFDDTDGSTVYNCKPVYDYLLKMGVLTTKSVWVYPPRGSYSGESLKNPEYLSWIRALQDDGFEIGLHNIGDGRFTRGEIIEGLGEFEKRLGQSPKVHSNHVSNTDNLYWWDRRFVWPISALYRLAYRVKRKRSVPKGGDNPDSVSFWGDIAQKKIKYVRNLTFIEVNTLVRDPRMPWMDRNKPYVNYWFSSSDGHDVNLFNDLLEPSNLDKLERQGGVCIVYTHFASGFVDKNGDLDPVFKSRIKDLASRDGWFVPCGQLLDYMLTLNGERKVGYWYKLTRNIIWILERFNKHFKYKM